MKVQQPDSSSQLQPAFPLCTGAGFERSHLTCVSLIVVTQPVRFLGWWRKSVPSLPLGVIRHGPPSSLSRSGWRTENPIPFLSHLITFQPLPRLFPRASLSSS